MISRTQIHPVNHHAIMETMDDVAATFLKEKRKEGMDQAYKRTQKKCTGK